MKKQINVVNGITVYGTKSRRNQQNGSFAHETSAVNFTSLNNNGNIGKIAVYMKWHEVHGRILDPDSAETCDIVYHGKILAEDKNSFIIAFFLTKFQIITCAPEDKNKAQKQDNGILTADALPPEPVMTLEAAAYPKLKKIKTELDSQNAIIFEVEKLRGSLEIEMSNLKGLAKLIRKGDLQRKIDEKTDYINRLKVRLSNLVRNSGFENMNEFLLTFRECRNAYTDYQRQYESWKNACRKPDTPTHKDEKLSDKLARLQREAAENQNSISRQTKNRGAR